MGHSLAAGVAANADAAGWLIGLADMPTLQVEPIASVQSAIKAGAPLAAPYYNGKRGHPVGFSKICRGDLLALRGDSGGRELLQRDAALIRRIAVADTGIFTDIDYPADLQAITGENQ
jgi:molybdenum cofactor cytidylyltransferase